MWIYRHPQKSPPQYSELKKKEENSGTEYVQCEPIFINRLHQEILRIINLTGTGEIVRDFFFYFSLLSVLFEFFMNMLPLLELGKHMTACLFQPYSTSQRIKETKESMYTLVPVPTCLLPEVPLRCPETGHLSTLQAPRPATAQHPRPWSS